MAEQEAFIGSVTEVTPTDEGAVEPVVGNIHKGWNRFGPAVNRLEL